MASCLPFLNWSAMVALSILFLTVSSAGIIDRVIPVIHAVAGRAIIQVIHLPPGDNFLFVLWVSTSQHPCHFIGIYIKPSLFLIICRTSPFGSAIKSRQYHCSFQAWWFKHMGVSLRPAWFSHIRLCFGADHLLIHVGKKLSCKRFGPAWV